MDKFDADRENPDDVFVNVGVGEDVTIKELAGLLRGVVGYEGDMVWNTDMPDGTQRIEHIYQDPHESEGSVTL